MYTKFLFTIVFGECKQSRARRNFFYSHVKCPSASFIHVCIHQNENKTSLRSWNRNTCRRANNNKIYEIITLNKSLPYFTEFHTLNTLINFILFNEIRVYLKTLVVNNIKYAKSKSDHDLCENYQYTLNNRESLVGAILIRILHCSYNN